MLLELRKITGDSAASGRALSIAANLAEMGVLDFADLRKEILEAPWQEATLTLVTSILIAAIETATLYGIGLARARLTVGKY